MWTKNPPSYFQFFSHMQFIYILAIVLFPSALCFSMYALLTPGLLSGFSRQKNYLWSHTALKRLRVCLHCDWPCGHLQYHLDECPTKQLVVQMFKEISKSFYFGYFGKPEENGPLCQRSVSFQLWVLTTTHEGWYFLL